MSVHAEKLSMPTPERALEGRAERMPIPERHFVNGSALDGEYPGMELVQLGMGCFWGAERKLWKVPGVVSTAVGYAGGLTPNPTYQEVCSGLTGHAEVVRVVFDPATVSLGEILAVFWENHDPTQGMRQGGDVGTQYRSTIYCYSPEHRRVARASLAAYQERLSTAGFGAITTEVADAPEFYFAEEYHQQYLAKNPNGYCGLGGTGVSCPVGVVGAE